MSRAQGTQHASRGRWVLTQVIQSYPPLMEIAGDLMFKSLDYPYADEIAERLGKMAGQGSDADPSQGAGMPPQGAGMPPQMPPQNPQ